MQEVTVEHNPKGLTVLIDEEVILPGKPRDELDVIAAILEATIFQQYENYVKRKNREERSKKKKGDVN